MRENCVSKAQYEFIQVKTYRSEFGKENVKCRFRSLGRKCFRKRDVHEELGNPKELNSGSFVQKKSQVVRCRLYAVSCGTQRSHLAMAGAKG